MKKLMEVVEVEDAGFMSLLGKNVVVFCANYIYTGKLTGVNDTCIELTDAAIVYETGKFQQQHFTDAQRTSTNVLFIQLNAVESFAETLQTVDPNKK
jgi:hypothetical protein